MTRIAGRKSSNFTSEHKKYIMLWNEVQTYKEISEAINVNVTTINNWCLSHGIRCKAAKKTGGKKTEKYLPKDENIKELVATHQYSILCVPWGGNRLEKVRW